MSTPRSRTRLRSALALIASSALALTLPIVTLAGPHGGGGGGHFGGGGHSFSGGGHFSAPHFAGGHSFGATHAAFAPHYAAPNFAAHPGYNGYHANANYGARPISTRPYAGGGNTVSHYVAPYGHGGTYGHGVPGGYYARGVSGRYIPGRAFAYRYWHGGYWHGGFWPAVYWGSGFAWFLPAIPAFAAAYWWDSVPYYYYNNVYYTYDPSQNGYVVTTPPPADESSAPASAPDASYSDPGTNPAMDNSSGAPAQEPPAADSSSTAGTGNLYAYPKNGQSEEQQSSDRQECAQWASGQTRSDGSGTSMDYQRALTACLQGRGYSVD